MRKILVAITATVFLLALTSASTPAGADPSTAGEGGAFGITASLAGTEVIPPTPEAAAAAPAFPAEDSETLIDLPLAPLVGNATLNADVAIHQAADLPSLLEVEEQGLAGPYNAVAAGSAEDVEVLVDAVAEDIPLIEADLLRGEVVAVCTGDSVEYSAQSEAVNLVIGGEAALGDLANDLIDQLFPALDPLDPIVNVEETVITELPGGGLAVDALVLTLLEAADAEVGLAQVRIGHAELDNVACGAGGPVDPPECSDEADNDDDGVIDAEDPGCHTDGDPENPDSYDPDDDDEADDGGAECSDTEDNDGDGVIDAEDPGCHTDGDPNNPDSYDPDDDDEADDGGPECSDTTDNDGDGVIDADDPGCHTDGDATNPDSYDPNDDTEGSDTVAGAGQLPLTGGSTPMVVAGGLLALGAALETLRRRSAA